MVRTALCHCQGLGFDPWSGNIDPTNHTVQSKYTHTHTHTHQSECIILHSHQQQIKVPIAHIFFGIISVPDFSYSNRRVVRVHCFKLYFPDDMMWSIFSHAYLPTYFFFDEVSIKVFGIFLIRLLAFLLNFKSSL